MHPGLENEIISDLSEEDIIRKITELQKRMGIAHTTGRVEVINQLQLLIDHYQSILYERMLEEQQKIIDADPKLGRKVIDIDWPDPNEEEDGESSKKKSKNNKGEEDG